MSEDSERQTRRDEVAKVKQREGSGAVPNVAEDELAEKAGDLQAEVRKALHDFEEEKGDWSKSRG